MFRKTIFFVGCFLFLGSLWGTQSIIRKIINKSVIQIYFEVKKVNSTESFSLERGESVFFAEDVNMGDVSFSHEGNRIEPVLRFDGDQSCLVFS